MVPRKTVRCGEEISLRYASLPRKLGMTVNALSFRFAPLRSGRTQGPQPYTDGVGDGTQRKKVEGVEGESARFGMRTALSK
jgi:hypothetical protein